MVLFGLASAPIFLVVMMMVADSAGERVGVAMGLINAVIYLAAGLAPLISALLSEADIRQGFLAPVITSAAAVPLMVIVWRWAAAQRTGEATPPEPAVQTAPLETPRP